MDLEAKGQRPAADGVGVREREGSSAMSIRAEQEITVEEATQLVQEVEDSYNAADVDRIVSGYSDDIVIRFGDVPEIRGKEAAERFISARFARIRNYRLTKKLRAVTGNVVGVSWEGSWEDIKTGKTIEVRGTEFWTLRDGKMADWEATVNTWEAGNRPESTYT